ARRAARALSQLSGAALPCRSGARRAAGTTARDGALQCILGARREGRPATRPLRADARAPRAPDTPERERPPATRRGRAAGGGRPVDPDLLALLTPCYLALQMGDCTLSTEIAADHPSDAHRLRAAAARYRDRLREQLLDGC